AAEKLAVRLCNSLRASSCRLAISASKLAASLSKSLCALRKAARYPRIKPRRSRAARVTLTGLGMILLQFLLVPGVTSQRCNTNGGHPDGAASGQSLERSGFGGAGEHRSGCHGRNFCIVRCNHGDEAALAAMRLHVRLAPHLVVTAWARVSGLPLSARGIALGDAIIIRHCELALRHRDSE